MELRMMERAGEIIELEMEKTIPLIVGGYLICKYRCDFVYAKTYRHPDGTGVVWEDAKGYRTREYQIKMKLVKALYGIEILET